MENKFQVFVYQNDGTEFQLDTLHLKDGKTETIAEGIGKVLDEYNL